MKTILFRTSLLAMLAASAFHAQSLSSLDGRPPARYTVTDLGTLGGPNSQASGPNGRGDLPIVSEISTPDPLKEDFCGFGNHLVCLGAYGTG